MPCRRAVVRLSCVVWLGIATLAAAHRSVAQETPSDTLLTVGHYFDLEAVSDPQISPDGSQIVYTRRWVNKARRPIRVDAVDHARRWDPRIASSPKAIAPHGRPMARASPTSRTASPKASQIYVRWVEGDPGPTQLTHLTESTSPTSSGRPTASRSASRCFVAKPVVLGDRHAQAARLGEMDEGPAHCRVAALQRRPPRLPGAGLRHLFVVEVDGGPASPAHHAATGMSAPGSMRSPPARWAGTGRPMARRSFFEGSRGPGRRLPLPRRQLYAVDVATGTTQPLTTEPGVWTHPVPFARRPTISRTRATRPRSKTYHTSESVRR